MVLKADLLLSLNNIISAGARDVSNEVNDIETSIPSSIW
jgi:hypothetical protein